jgi:hypothetical protein
MHVGKAGANPRLFALFAILMKNNDLEAPGFDFGSEEHE